LSLFKDDDLKIQNNNQPEFSPTWMVTSFLKEWGEWSWKEEPIPPRDRLLTTW
jgi:hypothetical protein